MFSQFRKRSAACLSFVAATECSKARSVQNSPSPLPRESPRKEEAQGKGEHGSGSHIAQFARPSADTNNVDAYTDQAAGSTNIYLTIDEVTESDADYIRTVTSPSNDVMVVKLSNVTDPVSSVNHVMRVATAVDLAAQESINFQVTLNQGYVSEVSQGTVIATLTRNGVTSTTFTVTTYTLSGAEADAITDYTALYYRILINKP